MQGAHYNWIMIGFEGAQNQWHERIKPCHHLLEFLFSLIQKAIILINYDLLILQGLLEALQPKGSENTAADLLRLLVVYGLVALCPIHLDLHVNFFVFFSRLLVNGR